MLHERDDSGPEEASKGSAVAIGFGPNEFEAVFELFRELRLVTPAADLEHGLTAARRLRPDMILVGSADARDVVAAVRRDPELRLVPVVALAVVPAARPGPGAEPEERSRVGRRTHHQVAQALQRLMLDEVMKVSYILASAANSGNETADRQVMMAIERLDNVAIGLRDAVIDLERGPS